jgi:hypothetical protein
MFDLRLPYSSNFIMHITPQAYQVSDSDLSYGEDVCVQFSSLPNILLISSVLHCQGLAMEIKG